MVFGALGAAAMFVAVTSFVLWLSGVGASPAEARLSRLAQMRNPRAIDAPFGERVLAPTLEGLTRFATELLPHSFVARITRRLTAAGSPMTTQAFFATVLILGAFLPGSIFLLVLLASNGAPSGPAVLLIVPLGVAGTAAPFLWLVRRIRARKLAIWKSMPDALDLMTVSVEAGLGLDAALRQVSEKLRGPLSDEISRTLREVGIGQPRRDAMQDMAERADVPELATFVNALIQAEQLGTSLSRVLRTQALSLRTRRRQRAEEMARKAPAKMVFPLVLFIMPSLFIVVVGPIIIRLVNYLSS
jgi:tight adherence protein C